MGSSATYCGTVRFDMRQALLAAVQVGTTAEHRVALDAAVPGSPAAAMAPLMATTPTRVQSRAALRSAEQLARATARAKFLTVAVRLLSAQNSLAT